MLNRITGSNPEDLLSNNLLSKVVDNESIVSRVFHFAQVISNQDNNGNQNRIKARIPLLDDVFYVGKSKEEGDKLLPVCIPFSSRFLEIPEVNSIVLVAIFDSKVPYLGRMYFDSFTELSQLEYFKRLMPNDVLLSNWDLVEKILSINIKSKPKQNELDSTPNIDYNVGIRGKGNNKILLNKDSISMTQNLNSELSSFSITKNIDVNSSNELNLLSKKGTEQKYHPVFDEELFSYLSEMNNVIKKIITALNTIPGISPVGACFPSSQLKALKVEVSKLSKAFSSFKSKGSSKKIKIN